MYLSASYKIINITLIIHNHSPYNQIDKNQHPITAKIRLLNWKFFFGWYKDFMHLLIWKYNHFDQQFQLASHCRYKANGNKITLFTILIKHGKAVIHMFLIFHPTVRHNLKSSHQRWKHIQVAYGASETNEARFCPDLANDNSVPWNKYENWFVSILSYRMSSAMECLQNMA